MQNAPQNNLSIIGLDFVAQAHDPSSPEFVPDATPAGSGIRWMGGSNILIEDCLIRDYPGNITFTSDSGPLSNISIRRSVILDSYSTNSHSQGLYISGGNGILIEGNVFD